MAALNVKLPGLSNKMSLHIEGLDSLRGRTLIIGSASSSVISQLAAELTVSSSNLSSSGRIWSPALAPITGPDPFVRTNRLAGPADFYADPKSDIVILIFRSPPIGKLANAFVQDLAVQLLAAEVARVIILAGSLGEEKHSIESDSFRCVSNEFLSKDDKTTIASLNWISYDPAMPIHGARFARKLHLACTCLKIPSMVLFKYCYEGDNFADAEDMVVYLNQLLKLFDESTIKLQLVRPPSWKQVYGLSHPISLY